MASQRALTIALVIALSSNIALLLIVLLMISNVTFLNNNNSLKLSQAETYVSPRTGDHVTGLDHGQTSSDVASGQNVFSDTFQRKQINQVSSVANGDTNHLLLRLLTNHLMQSGNPSQGKEQVYFQSSDSFQEADKELNNFLPTKQEYSKDIHDYRQHHVLRPFYGDRDLPKTTLDKIPSIKNSQKRTAGNVPDLGTNYFLTNQQSSYDPPRHLYQTETPISRLPGERARREAVAQSGEPASEEKWSQKTHEIFSTLTDVELAKFDPATYNILIPALIHFETMIIREIESQRSIIVSHDLRLEHLEESLLNMMNRNIPEPQADSTDNKSEPDSPSQILGNREGHLPVGNRSEILVLPLEVDGSGEGEWTIAPTTTSPRPTAVHNAALYDIYRILSTLEQKVMTLESYNVMSDSELTRVRSEVVKMDDKVTELDRQQRNLQIRTSMHTQKITEMEVYMSKSELGIHTALDSYSRVNARLETFKDKLTEFKNDLQAVSVQFGRHDQIANELRAADSYKAHDIQEVRKSVFGIEGRLSGLYGVLDHNLETVRTDLRAMLERVCTNNKLSC